MSTLFYPVFSDDSYDKFDELHFAVKANSDFIIKKTLRVTSETRFPERTVSCDHFNIIYFDCNGNLLQFEKNGWKLYYIKDPSGYGAEISLKIRDPFGRVKVASEDFQAFNSIKSLIGLKRHFDLLCEYDSWQSFFEEKKTYGFWTPLE